MQLPPSLIQHRCSTHFRTKRQALGNLGAVQKSVLDAWSVRQSDRDVVIKTNTGGGKTIVGLLLLQCCLHEKLGPAIYLAPGNHLAERVAEEGRKLGPAIVTGPDNGRFLSGEAICVTSTLHLLNGKSRFGLATPSGRPPVRVGSIVIDDAHAAVATMEDSARLTIPVSHAMFQALLELFEADLKAQALNTFMDIQDEARDAVLRIPFWAWRARHDAVLSILRPHRFTSSFEWAWALISDILPLCQAVVSASVVEIMSPCPPIEELPSFADAGRRIYLTATLAEDGVLVRLGGRTACRRAIGSSSTHPDRRRGVSDHRAARTPPARLLSPRRTPDQLIGQQAQRPVRLPIGGAEQARVMSCASWRPSRDRSKTRSGRSRSSVAVSPSPMNWRRTRWTVPRCRSRASATAMSDQPSPCSPGWL